MVTTKFYHDCRRVKDPNTAAPLKVSITKHGRAAYISLNVSLLKSQWDPKANRVINHPQKQQLNTFIQQRKVNIDNIVYNLVNSGECATLPANLIKDKVLAILDPKDEDERTVLFEFRFKKFAESHSKSTERIYMTTYRRLEEYLKQSFKSLRFEDITKDWLTQFDDYLVNTKGLSQNTRFIHFRNIRAVFNDAIDNEVTTSYPFRKFKFKAAPTRKRSFNVETLRKVLTAPIPEWLEKYRDIFALTFYLVGINIVDLCSLAHITEGRAIYVRAKTHKPYSIKVEPEAMAILNKYKGVRYALNILDHYKTYRTYYTQLYRGFHSLVEELNKIDDGIEVKELSTYWARHSWATIAASLDIPKETIAEALGHDMGNATTAIYIDFDHHKVDEANRRVIDWVLYGKNS